MINTLTGKRSMGIELQNNKIKVRLNKRFYVLDAIKYSLEDFKEIADFDLKINEKEYEIILKPKVGLSEDIEDNEIEKIGPEFCNYVLAMMKNKSMV